MSAWLNHRDENRAQAQAEIEAFQGVAGNHPLDIVMAVPFFEKLQPTLAANLLGNVPFSASIFLETHLRYGLQQGDRQTGILQNALVKDPDSPFFRLEASLEHLPPRGGKQSTEQLASLMEELPWYQHGLKSCVRVGIALRDDDWTTRCSLALLERSDSLVDAFDWIVETLEDADWYDALADIVVVVTRCEGWWRPEIRDRDEKALGLLALGGRGDEIVRFLNERSRIVSVSGEGDADDLLGLLFTRGGRMAMETLSNPALLQPEAALACGRACTFLGLAPLAKSFLASVESDRPAEDELRQRAESLAELCDLVPLARANPQDIEFLEQYLSILASVGIEAFQADLKYCVLQSLQNGRHHQALRLLRAGVNRLPQPEVLLMAAEILLNEMKEPWTALALLDQYSAAANRTSECWRTRCVALDKLGRVQEWLRIAQESRVHFPDDPDFLIEEGLALATLGEMQMALDLIHQGLDKTPDDARGLERFRMLAPRFEAHHRLLAVLSAALEKKPGDLEKRDAILQLLGTIEDHARDRLLHLYQRVYRRSGSDDEKKKELRGVLAALRNRLVSRPAEAGSRIERFAEENAQRVCAAIAEVQPLLAQRLIAAVFAEIAVDGDSSAEKRSEPAVVLVLQTAGLLEEEPAQARSALASVLQSHGYKGRIEVLELKEVWDDLRRESRWSLNLLLKGIPAGDFSLLNTLRMVDGHSRLILEKFDRYVVCYVVSGSFVRGTQRVDSDVDVWMVVDDADLRSMTRQDLREKLIEISAEFRDRIRSELAMSRQLNVQIYILSSFWRSLQAVDPIIVSLIRDGVPLHDRGLFSAWSRLLRDGHLRSTRESLDSQIQTVESLRSKAVQQMRRLADDLAEPIKYGTVKMLEILLQVLDLPVGHYRQVIELSTEELVRQRFLLSSDDLEVARRAVAYYKAVETGTIPPLEEALQLFRRIEEFIEKTRMVYRQLLGEKDRADLEEIATRLETVLATPEISGREGDSFWRERLALYRSEALQVLESASESDLGAVRISALVERLAEVALSLKLLESQQPGSVH